MNKARIADVVVVCIHDGFGNQLFQYAAGLALARHLGVPLKLDLRAAKPNTGRPYTLQHLAISAPEASEEELAALAPPDTWLDRAARRVLGARVPRMRPHQFRETRFYHFDPALFQVRAPVWIDGFWQSLGYVEPVRDVLTTEFRIVTEPRPEAVSLLRRIESCNAVCVHVRRGDYVGSSIFHSVPLMYYRQAAERLARTVDDPVYFVFSDDPQWTRANLELPGRVEWSWEPSRLTLIDDFRAMAACRHAILANSTLSWWAAFLHPKPGQQVYLPARWFAPTEWKPPELYVEGWTAL